MQHDLQRAATQQREVVGIEIVADEEAAALPGLLEGSRMAALAPPIE